MRKIRLSELSLCPTPTEMYTLGIGSDNRFAKVSLEFVETAKAASISANAAAASATAASISANAAAASATAAKNNSEAATLSAMQQTQNAQAATTAALLASKPVPLALSVDAPARITFGNAVPNFIKAALYPDSAMQNILYISDNAAVSVNPKGRIRVLAKGVSEVHIVPTGNTAIAQTVIIRVEDATLRLATRNKLRLTGSGKLRLN